MADLDEDGRHVVAAESLACGEVTGAAVVHEALDTVFKLIDRSLDRSVFIVVDVLMTVGNDFLGGHHVPDTVTSKHYKLGVVGNWDCFDVGVGCDRLILGLKQGVVLVLKVAEGARQSEHAVHAAILDEALCVVDSPAFGGIIGFVVLGQLDSLGVLGENRAGVTRVGADYLSGCNKDRGGGAASERLGVAIGVHVITTCALTDLVQLLLARVSLHHLVHLKEALFEGLLVALALETGQLHELLHEVLFDIESHFLAYS